MRDSCCSSWAAVASSTPSSASSAIRWMSDRVTGIVHSFSGTWLRGAHLRTPDPGPRHLSFPLPLQARVGRKQLLEPDLGVVELDGDLEIAPLAPDFANRAAAKAAMADPLARPEQRRVIVAVF